ncbi:MAG: hypothetical protein DMF75_02270, partial [Acidobacteria bacterium]
MAVRVVDTDVWSYLYKDSDEAKLYEPHLFGNILVNQLSDASGITSRRYRCGLGRTTPAASRIPLEEIRFRASSDALALR